MNKHGKKLIWHLEQCLKGVKMSVEEGVLDIRSMQYMMEKMEYEYLLKLVKKALRDKK